MNPLPTPYDILPIPYFAPEPGAAVWGGVLLLFLLLIASAWMPRRKRPARRSPPPYPFHDAESAIKKLMDSKSIRKEDLFELSRKLKAVIHAYEDRDISMLSPGELEAAPGDNSPNALSEFARQVASLDRLKFDVDFNESKARWAISTLLSAMYEYKKAVRRSLEEKHAAPPQ